MNILKFFHIIHNVYFKQKHFIKRKYYSSEGEDLFLKKKLNLKKKGFYVDVGAYHPIRKNNTVDSQSSSDRCQHRTRHICHRFVMLIKTKMPTIFLFQQMTTRWICEYKQIGGLTANDIIGLSNMLCPNRWTYIFPTFGGRWAQHAWHLKIRQELAKT